MGALGFWKVRKEHLQCDRTLPLAAQVQAWRRAARKMNWPIEQQAYSRIPTAPALEQRDREEGFIGYALCYGFGDDGGGNADSVLSGKLAWDYAVKRQKRRTWHCEYMHFDKPDHLRLRPGAPVRPKGFYLALIQPGAKYLSINVSQFRKILKRETGCGPEGLQFLAVTHPHFQRCMNERRIPFMALADYDVAPYGFNDFFDAVQLFCSMGIFGLGIGNVDRNYPLFGIATVRLPAGKNQQTKRQTMARDAAEA